MASTTSEQRGHEYVTGRAAVQPGAFHEPGQPRPSSSSNLFRSFTHQTRDFASALNHTARRFGESALRFPRQYPLAACLIGIGVGVILDRILRSSSRSR